MIVLDNGETRFALDDDGRLAELRHVRAGHDYAGGGGLWRMIWQRGRELEIETGPEAAVFSAEILSPSAARLRWSAAGELAFELEASARLEGARILFEVRLANRSDTAVLREFHFPRLGEIRLPPGVAYLDSDYGGRRVTDMDAYLDAAFTRYAASDHRGVDASTLYPGYAAFNFHLFSAPGQQLYVGSHDPSFQYTVHLLRRRGHSLDAMPVKYPFLSPGSETRIEGYVLAPLDGDWRAAARIYRDWMETWRAAPPPPDWIRDLNGWQRIILRHQYGEDHFRYADLPAIRDAGRRAGIDTLFLFGWHAGGHDADYPDYDADPEQGGVAALRERIARFRKNGGRVILYFNGQLIDTAGDYYRDIGRRISAKTAAGAEYTEQYRFGGPGTALRWFGNRTFVTACPACPEWTDTLKALVDRAVDLDVDGVFFDQLGFISHPCCDPSHGHHVPFMDVIRVKAELVRELARYTKERRPGTAFGIELLNDVTSQHVDFVHNGNGGYGPPHFHELARYLLPDLVLSDRDIRDDEDPEDMRRRVNHALRLGLRSDVEIYRCRATIDAAPRYRDYLTLADRFRDRHRDLVFRGRYVDTDGVVCDSPELAYSAYRRDGRLGVLLTAEAARGSVTAQLSVPGARFAGFDHLGEASAHATADGGATIVEVAPDALLLVLFADEGWEAGVRPAGV